MSVGNEVVYVKADRNIEVTKYDVTLGDVLSMECSNSDINNRLKTIRLMRIPEQGTKRFVISILRVIELIQKEFPGLKVCSLGESDFIVTFENQHTPNQFIHVIKIIAVVMITFIGAAFAIMSFNNDVATTQMFSQIYELMVGEPSDGFTILELTYSIGLTVGILVFFNHFGKKKFSVDPTPMEVEMRLYENDIQTTLLENSSRKGQEIDVGQTNPSGSRRT